MSFDFVDYKKDFPLLMQQDVAYLDSAATAQRPASVFAGRERIFMSRPTPTPCAACMNWAWRRLTVTRPPASGYASS